MNKIAKLLLAVVTPVFLMGAALMPVITANAADCNGNSVVWCGATSKDDLINKINNGDGHNSSANLKQIYYNENRGISEQGIRNSVEGSVTKSGQVIVNGQVVATNAWSSGREFMQNSVPDGSLWMRPPSVSFLSNSLDAWVNMDGGTFHFAILKTCGNPIKVINAPFGQIFKRVVNVTQNPNQNFAADTDATAIEANNGDTLRYEITVTNNGTGDMTNVHITDTLPTGVTLISNPAKRFIGDSAAAGVTLGTIAANNNLKTYTVTVKVDDNVADGAFVSNQACFTGETGGQKGCDTAVVKIKKKGGNGGASFVCTGLSKEQVGDQNSLVYKFTATASVANATVTGYIWSFGDNTSQETTTNTVTHTFTSADALKNATTTVRIKTDKGTETQVAPGCKVTFEVNTTVCTTCNNQPPCTETHNCQPTPPTTPLPQTGAEGAAAGAFGTGALGYSLRAWIRSKKSLLKALKR